MGERVEKDATFSKLLVAKHSPQNGCHVRDGEVLCVLPRQKLPGKDHVSHAFVSTVDRKTKSRYGWVVSVEPFTVDDFVRAHLNDEADDPTRHHVLAMLTRLSNLPPGIPVAVEYTRYGVEEPRVELNVHRVFFYPP
jgi:hypothetical protein